MKKLIIFTAALAGLIGIVAFRHYRAEAAVLQVTNKLLNNTQAESYTYQPNKALGFPASYHNDQGWLVVGTGEFSESSHGIMLSSPTDSVTLKLEHAGICDFNPPGGSYTAVDSPHADKNATSSFYMFSQFDPLDETYKKVTTNSTCDNSTPGDELDRTVTMTGLQKLNDEPGYGGLIYVRLDGFGDNQNSFRIEATNPDVKLGYVGEIARRLKRNASDSQLHRDIIAISGLNPDEMSINLANTDLPQWAYVNYKIGMGVACNDDTIRKDATKIRFRDVDDITDPVGGVGEFWQGTNNTPHVRFVVLERSKGGGDWNPIKDEYIINDGAGRGPNRWRTVEVGPFKKGHDYEFHLKNVYRANAVQMTIEGDTSLTTTEYGVICNQKPRGEVIADCRADGRIYVSMKNVIDPDGGNMNTDVYGIRNGPSPAQTNGSGDFVVGDWGGQIMDGVERSLTGYAYDAQTNEQVTLEGGKYTCPKQEPEITVTGQVYDAHDMGHKYEVDIKDCNGTVLTRSGSDGTFSFTLKEGTQFCIYSDDRPNYASSVQIRPVGLDYKDCAKYTRTEYQNPNYCYRTVYDELFALRNTDGFDLAIVRPEVYFDGTLYNAYNMGVKYGGITVDLGVPNVTVNYDSGYFWAILHKGDNYHVRVNDSPRDAYDHRVRPYGERYHSCSSYDTSISTPNYCTSHSEYLNQRAGDTIGGPFDRTSDRGFDFVYRFPPKVSCYINPAGDLEPGMSFEPEFFAADIGGATEPVITDGTANMTIVGVGDSGDVDFDELSPRGTDVQIDMGSYVLPDPTSYTMRGSVEAIGDDITVNQDCSPNPADAAYKPYFKVFGGDVWAGGSFGSGTCSSDAHIYGYATGSGTSSRGASGQFGVTALLSINRFYSASNRQRDNPPTKGLSFSNTAGDTDYGGDFSKKPDGTGNRGICIPDYYTTTQDPDIQAGGSFPPGSYPSGRNQYILPAGDRTFGGITIPTGSQIAVFVDGDVYINSNIRIRNGARTRSAMPYFALIVRGNIYIANNVARLDGMYVAQPRGDGSKGIIYTCARNGSLYSNTEIYGSCNDERLAVNGSLVAKQVKFLRTLGSLLLDSTPGEVPDPADGSGTKAAEVINYTPELFLAPSPLKDTEESASTGAYDAIVTLPPVF